MDELREELLKHLQKNFAQERDFYIVVKSRALEFAAGFPGVSKEPFRKVYDVVSEVAQEFFFGRASNGTSKTD